MWACLVFCSFPSVCHSRLQQILGEGQVLGALTPCPLPCSSGSGIPFWAIKNSWRERHGQLGRGELRSVGTGPGADQSSPFLSLTCVSRPLPRRHSWLSDGHRVTSG